MVLKVSPMNGSPKADGGNCLQQLGNCQSRAAVDSILYVPGVD